jgi:nucleoside 2-deoxyribosyltransferase
MSLIYIASKFALKDKVESLYQELLKLGHIITVTWWYYESKKELGDLTDYEYYQDKRVQFIKKHALFGIDNCDIYVLLSDTEKELDFNGASFEMGYATARGKEIYIIGKVGRSAVYSGARFCKDEKGFLSFMRLEV